MTPPPSQTRHVSWSNTGEFQLYNRSPNPVWKQTLSKNTPESVKNKRQLITNWTKHIAAIAVQEMDDLLVSFASKQQSPTALAYMVVGAVFHGMMQVLEEKRTKIEKTLGGTMSSVQFKRILKTSIDYAPNHIAVVNTLENSANKKGYLSALRRATRHIAQAVSDGIEANLLEIYAANSDK